MPPSDLGLESHPDGSNDRDHNGGSRPRTTLLAFTRRGRREQALQRLEEGYQEVVGVIGALHRHMESQGERTEQIVGSLQRLAQTSSAQQETLGAIAEEMRRNGERWNRLDEALSRIPELADAQREALTAIGRRMDAERQQDERLAATMDGLRATVGALGNSATASTQALTRLHQDVAERDRHLMELIHGQSRRFVWLFALTVVVVAAGVTIGVLALLRG